MKMTTDTVKKNRVQKAKKEITVSDLKIDAEGNYIISSQTDAIKAVELAGKLSANIDQIKAEQLNQLEADYEHLRKALKKYQDERELAEIRTENYRSDLIERTGNMWILTEDEIELVPEGVEAEVVPLMVILKRKIKNRMKRQTVIDGITDTVLNRGKLDDMVKRGVLKQEEIEPAFVEFVSTSYVQIKENK